MNKDDGGPAFPLDGNVDADNDIHRQYRGMSLRDYFASQALIGYRTHKIDWQIYQPKDVASWCYSDADAMIAERNKP